MTNKDLFNALRGIDEKYILESAPDEKKETNSVGWLRVAAVAACVCLMFGAIAGIAAPIALKMAGSKETSEAGGSKAGTTGETGPEVTLGSVNTEGIAPSQLPDLPMVAAGQTITGESMITIGKYSAGGYEYDDTRPPSFDLYTVVEARVIEVLPDVYYLPGEERSYRIARLQILDEIRSTGLPDEVYFRYSDYGTDVFDGFDSLILTMRQVGIENYLMANRTQSKIEYFPNMFNTPYIRDIKNGSVIAFTNGVLDESFWVKEDGKSTFAIMLDSLEENPDLHFEFPFRRGSTVSQVRRNILNMEKADPQWYKNNLCDYISVESIFDSENARLARTKVMPDQHNSFLQKLTISSGVVTVEYTRLINGFPTEERIVVTKYTDYPATVSQYKIYDPEDLLSVPDLGVGMSELDLSGIEPPHVTFPKNLNFQYCQATGYYRKVNGQIYGIIRIVWAYGNGGGLYRDDCYYLYDSIGKGRIVERDELREIIGGDRLILDFEYGQNEFILVIP